jgi:hypothetical protein
MKRIRYLTNNIKINNSDKITFNIPKNENETNADIGHDVKCTPVVDLPIHKSIHVDIHQPIIVNKKSLEQSSTNILNTDPIKKRINSNIYQSKNGIKQNGIKQNPSIKIRPLDYNHVINIKCSELLLTNIIPNIIISFTTIPSRLGGDNLIKVIKSLFNQRLKPKYIFLHVCSKYNKDYKVSDETIINNINKLQLLFPFLIIIRSPDLGPGTKLLGMLYVDQNKYPINPEDRIIVVDDDCPMTHNMTLHYEMCYQLYGSDCIFINEQLIIDIINNKQVQNKKSIYYDNYKNGVYGWLSFSFKMKHVTEDMKTYLEQLMEDDKRILYHDDLFFTLYYRTKKLNASGLNLRFNNITRDVDAVMNTGLHVIPGARKMRIDLENLFSHKFNINWLDKTPEYVSDNIIQKSIDIRYLLRNVENIDYNRDVSANLLQLDIKHFNDQIIIITCTKFVKSNQNTFTLTGKSNDTIILEPNYFSNKQSYFFNVQNKIEMWPNINSEIKLFQTSSSTNMCLKRFYSIYTIISYLPYLKYQFFDDSDIMQWIKTSYPNLIYVYNKLNVGAYKADIFRALYAYKNGGIYFDCKQILFTSLKFMFSENRLLIKDVQYKYIYNGMFYIQPLDYVFREYLKKSIKNIHISDYTTDCLSITGPGVFTDIIDVIDRKKLVLQNTNDIKDIIPCVKKNNIIIIKNHYNGYYEENNYKNTTHYNVMWKKTNVFKEYEEDLPDNYNPIDYIL